MQAAQVPMSLQSAMVLVHPGRGSPDSAEGPSRWRRAARPRRRRRRRRCRPCSCRRTRPRSVLELLGGGVDLVVLRRRRGNRSGSRTALLTVSSLQLLRIVDLVLTNFASSLFIVCWHLTLDGVGARGADERRSPRITRAPEFRIEWCGSCESPPWSSIDASIAKVIHPTSQYTR